MIRPANANFLTADEASSPEGTSRSKETQNLGPLGSLGTGADGSLKVKTLPPSVVKDIEQKNVARKLAGLSPIIIKVRRCIACGSMFESAGNRTCGCSSRTAGTIAGREII
jgi:hypothetical protein